MALLYFFSKEERLPFPKHLKKLIREILKIRKASAARNIHFLGGLGLRELHGLRVAYLSGSGLLAWIAGSLCQDWVERGSKQATLSWRSLSRAVGIGAWLFSSYQEKRNHEAFGANGTCPECNR